MSEWAVLDLHPGTIKFRILNPFFVKNIPWMIFPSLSVLRIKSEGLSILPMAPITTHFTYLTYLFEHSKSLDSK